MKMQGVRGVFVLLLVFLSSPVASAHTWTAEVLHVGDGDSFVVRREGRSQRIRLYGIDSPELEQAHGRSSRQIARTWLQGQRVAVEPIHRDNYGRTVALVWLDGRLINAELVRSGAAWVSPKFCQARGVCDAMHEMQQQARQARLGLWQDAHPEPPWLWKRRHPQQKRR